MGRRQAALMQWFLLLLIPPCLAAAWGLWYFHCLMRSSALIDRWAADANYKVVEKAVVRVRLNVVIVYRVTLTNENGEIRRAHLQYGGGWEPKVDVSWTYFVHIRRRDGSGITLDEWCAAVEQTDGVRLISDHRSSINPFTGGEFQVAANPGDTEVFLPETGAWEPRFGWLTPERISFRWTPEFDQADWPVRQAACRLAKVLDAVVAGDEGEQYTLS